MIKVKVRLKPIINNINLPTVIKTAILPGETMERLFIATQVGEIFYTGDRAVEKFLDIRSQIIELPDEGFDERGLIGLAFHPQFSYNGLFYIHYSVIGTKGSGAIVKSFNHDPCELDDMNLKWEDRENNYDHIDTVEEWISQANNQPRKLRTLLNLRRPFSNHNGFNSLNFSPENGKLILTVGDGGRGYDPFNLSQNDMEIFGKIIEIDVNKNTFINDPPVVTRFNELPMPIQETLGIMAKGVRNISGITFQKINNQYIKYIGNVGQRMVESIYAFTHYKTVPVTLITQNFLANSEITDEEFINFGWRGWEGVFPTLNLDDCPDNSSLNKEIITYYDEALKLSTRRLPPLTCFYHKDSRPNKFEGVAITGVRPYMGNEIPTLTGKIVFTNLNDKNESPAKGTLAYTDTRRDCKLNDYSIIDVDYNFESQPAFYVGLGENFDQTKLYLGVYNSPNASDFNMGTIFEIVP